jgi:hypothetical protein
VGFEVFTAVTMKREREREVSGSERHYNGWEGKEFNISVESSQALLVCTSGKAFNRYY